MDDFNDLFKIQMLNNHDLNSISLITEEFMQLNVPQTQIHRNWQVGELLLLSFSTEIYQPGSRSRVWFHYILRVTQEFGRGLELVVPKSFDTHDKTFKQMYRDNFKIPMLQARTTYEDFSNLYANLQIPADAYFASGRYVLFDTGFTSPATTPLWYILNHNSSTDSNMYLTGNNFRPKRTFKIRRSGSYPLYIFYGKNTQNNLDRGRDINEDMIDVGETKENTLRQYDIRF